MKTSGTSQDHCDHCPTGPGPCPAGVSHEEWRCSLDCGAQLKVVEARKKEEALVHKRLHPEEWDIVVNEVPDPDIYRRINKR